MEKPDMNRVRGLLEAKDFKAIAEIEPLIMKWCEKRIKTNHNDGFSIQSLFLNTIENLECNKKKDPQNPLLDYCLGLTAKLMKQHHLIRIDNYKDIQVGDATYYCWKHKGKVNHNPVDVIAVYDNQKVKIRYTHQQSPLDGFEHTFKSNNFKFAIRQLSSLKKERANAKYKFFFFDS